MVPGGGLVGELRAQRCDTDDVTASASADQDIIAHHCRVASAPGERLRNAWVIRVKGD